ncbi:sulfatase [Candidatus Nanosalina sp. VS9-1]|uniref:sulfatase n=1 Tax=Candidatus Nanosalina sp. VS9-1 TaxID=3388566 RepID=UPI0039E0AF26
MSEKPNIVHIVMDTARADTLSCYGCEDETSPFLDSLAEGGVKYERPVSQAVWTMPSHASMFTGKHQHHHGVMTAEDDLRNLDMFPSHLSERGYETIGVVNVPFLWPQYGFDEYFDRYDYVNSNYMSKIGVMEDIEKAEGIFGKFGAAVKSCYREEGFRGIFNLGKYLTKEVLLLNDSGAKRTNEIALNHANASDNPFYMFINYLEVHDPYSPPFPYSHKFLDNKKKWLSLTSLASFSPYVRRHTPHFYRNDVDVNHEELETMKNLYKGEQRYLDGKIKELYDSIKEDYPNTVFIITSDHGEAFGEHDHFEHFGSLHDEVTRVPLIEDFPEDVNKNIEYQVETRQLHDHIIDIADGTLKPIDEVEYAITEYPGRDIANNPKFVEGEMIYDFTKDSVSVEKDGEKVIRGYSEENIRINSDFREEEAEEVFEGLEEKAESMIDKLKIFT